MREQSSEIPDLQIPEFLSGGGSMGTLIRSFDWSKTQLGPVSSWPQSLRSAISICLNSNFPIAIYWGKDLTLVYNDAWSPIPGNKHPWSLGKPAREVWPEIWDAIEPHFQTAFSGRPGGSKDALLPMQRHGYTEECYFDFTFTPVYGEAGSVEGVFNAVIETTYRVISERRTAFLKNLSMHLTGAKTSGALYELAAADLNLAEQDLSFSMLYVFGDASPTLVASSLPADQAEPAEWPFNELIASKKALYLPSLERCWREPPRRYWPELPVEGYMLPLLSTAGDVLGCVVCGLSARRRMDEDYRVFLDSIGNTISTAMNIISALDEERRKAAALAEIDRAKTVFFSNISHEFRTPLTLMLGSLEQLLNSDNPALSTAHRSSVSMAHRNAIRLLRLVNDLLDFNRIEAGRAEAKLQATDLAAFTGDIAAGFRSLMESGGLSYEVNIAQIEEPVFVDRDMWEKILLNLLSNAFKYTLEGSVDLSLVQHGDRILLQVRDTGVGIPESELPVIFERFHRVETNRGRSYEGTGIGLSLINELVRLHNGTLSVTSNVGSGSTFTVDIPVKPASLPVDPPLLSSAVKTQDERLSASQTADLFRETAVPVEAAAREALPTVLVVDDNADMRNYFHALLRRNYNVRLAKDGQEALTLLGDGGVDLVVSDIMMPVMDGLALLKAVKEDPATAALPVILVSARAGEDEKLEGLDTGADDYLVKPFSSKELLAKVRSQINLANKRLAAVQELYRLLDDVPFAVAVLKGPSLKVDFVNRYNLEIWQRTREEVIGRPLLEVFPGDPAQAVRLHDELFRTGERVMAHEFAFDVEIDGKRTTRYFTTIITPMVEDNRTIVGQIATAIEITEQVEARKRVEQSEILFRTMAETLPQMVWVRNVDGTIEYGSKDWEQYSGIASVREAWKAMVAPEDWPMVMDMWQEATKTETSFRYEIRLRNKEGQYKWHYATAEPVKDDSGKVIKWVGALVDISVQKDFAEQLEREVAERTEELRMKNVELEDVRSFLQQLIDSSVEFISVVDLDLRYVTVNRRFEEAMHIKREDIRGRYALDITPNAEGSVQLECTRRAMKGETVYLPKNNTLWRSDLYLDSYFIPLVIQGRIEGVIVLVRDVTELVRSEQLLEEKNRELARSNEDLEQFAHVASHDLKEPVRKMRLFATRLKTEFDTLLPERGHQYLEKIQHAADRIYSMIEGVLMYSSLATGEQTMEDVDIGLVLNEVESALEVLIAEKSAVITRGDLPVVRGAQHLLYQLFYNLVNNSLKFSKEGVPPKILVTALEATAVPGMTSSQTGRRFWNIVVSDNGIGFDQEDADVIFQSFARLNSKDRYEGTGLGLSLVKKIVDRHQGYITAHSRRGEGASFSIYFPA